jgi:hypothetical protein
VILGGLGTLVYFLEALAYSLVVLINLFSSDSFFFPLQYPFMFFVQALGLVFTSAGFFIFNWSVIIRGRYAVSWNMLENHKLIGRPISLRAPSFLPRFLSHVYRLATSFANPILADSTSRDSGLL